MEIVYTNRRQGEARVHLELDAGETAALIRNDPAHKSALAALIADANRRLNPPPAGRS